MPQLLYLFHILCYIHIQSLQKNERESQFGMWFDEQSIDWLIKSACKFFIVFWLYSTNISAIRHRIRLQCAKLICIHHCRPTDRLWWILSCRSQLGTTTTRKCQPHKSHPVYFFFFDFHATAGYYLKSDWESTEIRLISHNTNTRGCCDNSVSVVHTK